MSHYKVYVIVCDICGKPVDWEQRAERLPEARKNAAAIGWSIRGDRADCGEHGPRKAVV